MVNHPFFSPYDDCLHLHLHVNKHYLNRTIMAIIALLASSSIIPQIPTSAQRTHLYPCPLLDKFLGGQDNGTDTKQRNTFTNCHISTSVVQISQPNSAGVAELEHIS